MAERYQDTLRFILDLNRKDWVAAQIVMLYIDQPGVSHATAANVLTRRFGTQWGFSNVNIGRKVQALLQEHPAMSWFLS